MKLYRTRKVILILSCLPVLLALFATAVTQGEILIATDFQKGDRWSGIQATSLPQPDSATATATISAVGTIDDAGSTSRSNAMMLTVAEPTQPGWSATMSSGMLPNSNQEASLGKLTLSFDHSVSINRPIEVQIESFSSDRKLTGGLKTTVYPSAANFYSRAALELSDMVAFGEGKFDPIDSLMQFSFGISTLDSKSDPSAPQTLAVDNVAFSNPAYYVSPEGNDANDGRSEATAFANPQQALNVAQPGDIVVLMNGRYEGDPNEPPLTPVAKFVRPGSPSAWITLKNYPGHMSTISSRGQLGVSMIQEKGEPTLAYLEVRGLRVRGNGETVREQYEKDSQPFTPNSQARGIEANGRTTPYPGERTDNEIVHHIRIADNVVEYCTDDGIYAEYCDWLYVEGNVVENNCWATQAFAPAGLSVMGFANFDGGVDVHKMLISRNRVSGNRLYVKNQPWGKVEKTNYFNGNGILLDANAEKPPTYFGRTLVQNNLVFNNGGGGIQMWFDHRIDLVNNTVYHNGTTPELKWGQIGFEYCSDVRLVNNIIVAQPDRPLDTWMVNRVDKKTSNIRRFNNLYWGGVTPNIAGEGDINTAPQFIKHSEDSTDADFRIAPNSPAVAKGLKDFYTPLLDLNGKPRPSNIAPTLGAFQE